MSVGRAVDEGTGAAACALAQARACTAQCMLSCHTDMRHCRQTGVSARFAKNVPPPGRLLFLVLQMPRQTPCPAVANESVVMGRCIAGPGQDRHPRPAGAGPPGVPDGGDEARGDRMDQQVPPNGDLPLPEFVCVCAMHSFNSCPIPPQVGGCLFNSGGWVWAIGPPPLGGGAKEVCEARQGRWYGGR